MPSRYYVRPEKLRRLELAFQTDIRKLKKMGIRFDMKMAPIRNFDNFGSLGFQAQGCGTCLVGAHVVCNSLKRTDFNDNEIGVAARDLRVKREWLAELYHTFNAIDVKYSKYPQASKLSLRLQEYAKEIGA